MGRKSIRLKAKDRVEMERFCKTGIHSVKLVNRARIIPALDTSGGRTPDSQEVCRSKPPHRQLCKRRFSGGREREGILAAEKTRNTAGTAKNNRRIGSPHNRVGVRESSQGLCQMDITTFSG